MESILVLGAKSDIARAVAHRFAQAGFDIILAARGSAELESDALDLQIRYRVKVQVTEFDALMFDSHPAFYGRLDPKPIGVVCAIGHLGDQKLAAQDFAEAKKLID